MDGDREDRQRDFVIVTPHLQVSIGRRVLFAGIAFVVVAAALAIVALNPFGITDDIGNRGATIVALLLLLVAIGVGIWITIRRSSSSLTTR